MSKKVRAQLGGSKLALAALRSTSQRGAPGPGLVLAIALIVSLIASAATAAEVRLRSSAVCSGSIVRLADVAEIYCDDGRLAQALAETPLCPAPHAGRQRSLSQQELRQMLVLSGVEKSIAVTGSEAVSISSGSAGRTAELPKRAVVASGVRQAAFEAEAELNQKVSGRTRSRQPAPSPTDDDKSSPADPQIEKGAIVTVHAFAAGVRVSTSGKALEDGANGETIPVELADTKQRVQARIVGPQTVEVGAGAAAAPRP